MGTRRNFIKTDYDQRTDFPTAVSLFNERLQVELDVEEEEAVKLDMFASAEIRSLTQPITDIFLFGQLSGSDVGAPPLAQERLIIPASTQINVWDGAISLSWIVEPPTPGTKTFNFDISARGEGNLISISPRGLNAIAFKTNQQ
ncbi:hypothetical protein [Alteribacillus sp. YIM 98480]|uniref:hypothetical protein n=1 Tax=Alteribacillus sp. YIM 98480 TaxID=2606599 RepID=UPI00131B719F|nr:hypothetical protein [Alteribacillus sp. YIM 98480]